MGLAQYTPLGTLDANAVITKYSAELRRKAIPRDIYTSLRGDNIIYRGERMAIPNNIYQKISPKDQSGANNIRVVLKLPINSPVLTGNTVARGTEIAPIIRTGTLYRANYRIVVQDTPGYGENRLDAEPYRLYENHVKDLAPHAAAEEGFEIRMALVESNSFILQNGTTAANTPAQWNRNFFVLGLNTIAQQPVFHPTFATYTNRIVGAINTASGGNGQFAQTTAQMLDGLALDNISRWAFQRRMMPLYINGRSAFILTVSMLGAAQFSNPSFTDSLGARWTSINRLNNEKIQNWYGILGVWRSAAGCDIYIVLDERLPTLLVSGTAEPFGMQANYMWPTEDDRRQLDNPIIRDAMILHGAGAIVNFEPEKLHMIEDDWDYRVRRGKGYAGVRGIQQLQFDTTPVTANGTAREYYGSAVIVGGRVET